MIFRKPWIGYAVILLLLCALATLVFSPRPKTAKAAGEIELVDTCPPGYLLNNGSHFRAPGKVCLPGYLPQKKPASDALKEEGRQG